MPEKIPSEVLVKLLKLQATYSHPTTPQGEAGNAFGLLRAILAKHKLTFEDFYAVQHRGVHAGGARRNDDSDRMAEAKAAAAKEFARKARAERERKESAAEAERQRQAWRAESERKRAERARKEAPERDAVIKRYGSEQAVLEPCTREARLRKAVWQWSVFDETAKYPWTISIAGWKGPGSPMPANVRNALAKAYPLPDTIEAAWAEFDHWEKRDREIGLVVGDTSDTQLGLSVLGRQDIVRNLLETGLRARTLAEVLIRQRYSVSQECVSPEVDKAIQDDLEAMIAAMAKAPPDPASDHGRHETATQRREKVIRLLSDAKLAALSDREIARRIGVAPKTVGNIRRRLMAKPKANAA